MNVLHGFLDELQKIATAQTFAAKAFAARKVSDGGDIGKRIATANQRERIMTGLGALLEKKIARSSQLKGPGDVAEAKKLLASMDRIYGVADTVVRS
jgi:hypothetical protein